MVSEYELKVMPYNDRIIYPLQNNFRPAIVVTNTGDEDVILEFRHLTGLPWHVFFYPQGTPPFPKGNRLYLAPRESEIVHVLVPITNIKPGEHIFSIELEFYNVKEIYEPPKLKKVCLTYKIMAFLPKELENTSVRGHVLDKKTLKPIPNAEIKLKATSNYNPSGKTDENGFYEIKCHANYNYQIQAEAPCYAWEKKFLHPPIKGPLKVDFHLDTQKEKIEYSIKTYKGFSGGVIGVMSENGKYIILGYRGSNGNTIYMFDIDGVLVWKKTMDCLNSTWGINISDDGSYVVAANLGKQTAEHGIYEDPEIILFNKKGEVIWKIDSPGQCREVVISHNNKYMASQGSLDICLFELESGKLLWKQTTKGQVRNIRFSNDDSFIYVGSGSDYLFKYDIHGNLIWKTYTGSWPENHHSTAVSKDDSFILTNGHLGEVTLIDKLGNILWGFESGGFSAVSISPDNSYVLVASNGSLGTAKVSIEGKILWRRDPSSGFCGVITGDARYIITASLDVVMMDVNGNILWSFKPVQEKEGQGMPLHAQFLTATADGSRIVVAYTDGTFCFFRKNT